jgi:bis(5'-nucleosidyl)-tetraphosphatase
MKQVKACGFILFRRDKSTDRKSFLLMKHADRYDLPKGHLEPGESELDCALREMNEETGIPIEAVEMTLVIFLGWVDFNTQINISEHLGYEWFDWNPPHQIQILTIDPLLTEVATHLTIMT